MSHSQELIPGLGAALGDRATELARAAHGRRRRRWRTTTAAFGIAIVVSSGAYAARGLWQPDLGTQTSSSAKVRAVATAEPPEQALLSHLAPLRREQTEADRGEVSRAALKLAADRYRVLTNSVRQLSVLEGGNSLVLIPMISQTDGSHQLCMAIQRDGKIDGRACSMVPRVLDGGLVIGMGDMPDPEIEKEMAAIRRAASEKHAEKVRKWKEAHPGKDDFRDLPMRLRGVMVQTPPHLMKKLAETSKLHVVGVVPDGVAQVEMGKGGPRFPVKDNVFRGSALEAELGTLTATFLDAAGNPLPPLVKPDPVVPPTAEEAGQLRNGFRRWVNPQLSLHYDELVPALLEICTAIRQRPRPDQEELVALTVRKLGRYTGDTTTRRPRVALELIQRFWCKPSWVR